MKTIEIPVLIVGGGPVGLCASILLSHHGVPSLLVERHTGTSLYPKARLVNARTMEIFRQCGLEQAVREISLPPEQSRHAIWARTLVGEELQRRTIVTAAPDLSEGVSPTFGCTTSQEVLEPVLLRCARQFNLGQVRFSSELTTFIQDGFGISATLLDREQGEQTQVRAQYLLGADGAHQMPPAGGFRMNTGMQDVQNLAWKLAAVLVGWAGPALLETYEREREPVDRWTTEQTLRNLASIRRVGTGATEKDTSMHEGRQELFHEQGLIFGAAYESATVLPDGTAPPEVTNPVTDYAPTAHPGCRAPHIWLERVGPRLSTLDLFGTSFVLLAGRTGTAWCQAAAKVAHARRLPVHAFTVEAQGGLVDPGGSWATTYGVEQDGAVLVRPDGHVAWRARSCVTNPAETLQRVLASMLGEMASQEAWSSV